MGYIAGGGSNLKVYLTQKGREYLLTGNEEDIIVKHFALGDSDTNYLTSNRDGNGLVPDVTGDNLDCIHSVTGNVGVRYFLDSGVVVNTGTTLPSGGTITPPPTPPAPITKQVKLQRGDTDEFVNTVDCVINLDQYARYFLYHNSINALNPSARSYEELKSPIIDFYKKVNVFDETATIMPDVEISIVPDSLTIFKGLSRTYLNDNGDGSYSNVDDLNNCFLFLFSSFYSNGARNGGSSAGGMKLLGREYGYAFNSASNANKVNGWTWLTARDLETRTLVYVKDSLGQIIKDKSDFFLPAAKIRSIDPDTNLVNDFMFVSQSDSQFTGGTPSNNYSNQYCKSFGPIGIKNDGNFWYLDGQSVMTHEVSRMKLFIENSQYFRKVSGTEYRTDPIVFTVKSKVADGSAPAKLKVTLKFDPAVMMGSDTMLSQISDEGNKQFIQYL